MQERCALLFHPQELKMDAGLVPAQRLPIFAAALAAAIF